MRLAGTARQYSKKAMPQLIAITIHSGLAMPPFKCQYQAIVMKQLDSASRATVHMAVDLFRLANDGARDGRLTRRRQGRGIAFAAQFVRTLLVPDARGRLLPIKRGQRPAVAGDRGS